jgi:hypothetical protein
MQRVRCSPSGIGRLSGPGRREQANPCRGVASGPSGGLPEFGSFMTSERLIRGFPAAMKPGERQICGQLPSAEPHRRARGGGIPRRCDGIAGDLAGVARVELTHQDSGVGEAGEELLLARSASDGRADRSLERDPRCFLPPVPLGLLLFGATRPPGRSPVAWGRAPQPIAFFGRPARWSFVNQARDAAHAFELAVRG